MYTENITLENNQQFIKKKKKRKKLLAISEPVTVL